MTECTFPGCQGAVQIVAKADGKRFLQDAAYCSKCGTLYKGGEPIIVNEQFSIAVKDLNKSASQRIQKMLKEMKEDPDIRIQYYFEQVWSEGFMMGFQKGLEVNKE